MRQDSGHSCRHTIMRGCKRLAASFRAITPVSAASNTVTSASTKLASNAKASARTISCNAVAAITATALAFAGMAILSTNQNVANATEATVDVDSLYGIVPDPENPSGVTKDLYPGHGAVATTQWGTICGFAFVEAGGYDTQGTANINKNNSGGFYNKNMGDIALEGVVIHAYITTKDGQVLPNVDGDTSQPLTAVTNSEGQYCFNFQDYGLTELNRGLRLDDWVKVWAEDIGSYDQFPNGLIAQFQNGGAHANKISSTNLAYIAQPAITAGNNSGVSADDYTGGTNTIGGFIDGLNFAYVEAAPQNGTGISDTQAGHLSQDKWSKPYGSDAQYQYLLSLGKAWEGRFDDLSTQWYTEAGRAPYANGPSGDGGLQDSSNHPYVCGYTYVDNSLNYTEMDKGDSILPNVPLLASIAETDSYGNITGIRSTQYTVSDKEGRYCFVWENMDDVFAQRNLVEKAVQIYITPALEWYEDANYTTTQMVSWNKWFRFAGSDFAAINDVFSPTGLLYVVGNAAEIKPWYQTKASWETLLSSNFRVAAWNIGFSSKYPVAQYSTGYVYAGQTISAEVTGAMTPQSPYRIYMLKEGEDATTDNIANSTLLADFEGTGNGIIDTQYLTIPEGTEPGRYTLWLVSYDVNESEETESEEAASETMESETTESEDRADGDGEDVESGGSLSSGGTDLSTLPTGSAITIQSGSIHDMATLVVADERGAYFASDETRTAAADNDLTDEVNEQITVSDNGASTSVANTAKQSLQVSSGLPGDTIYATYRDLEDPDHNTNPAHQSYTVQFVKKAAVADTEEAEEAEIGNAAESSGVETVDASEDRDANDGDDDTNSDSNGDGNAVASTDSESASSSTQATIVAADLTGKTASDRSADITFNIPVLEPGTYEIQLVDVSGTVVDTHDFTINESPVKISIEDPKSAKQGEQSPKVTITGKSENKKYAVQLTDATGKTVTVTLDSNGKFTVPTDVAVGSATVSVVDVDVTDPDNPAVLDSDTLTVTDGVAPVASFKNTLTGKIGDTVNFPITVNDESSFTCASSNLPAGLTIDPNTCVISGTITAKASGTATVTVTDANGNTTEVSVPYTFTDPSEDADGDGVPNTIDACAATPAGKRVDATGCPDTQVPTFGETSGLSDGKIVGKTGTAITPVTLTATDNFEGDLTFGVKEESELPAGLELNSTTGVISGTPTEIGSGSFTVTVSDQDGNTAEQVMNYEITDGVNPVVTVSGVLSGDVGTPVEFAVNVTDDTTTTCTATGLPDGLTINASTCVISGTPTTVGNGTIVVTVTDAANNSTTIGVTYNIIDSSIDSDGDEVPDYVESHVDETDPNDPDDVKDSDGDGVPDYVENKEGTDPADVDEFKDSDSDGLPDYVERHTCYDSSFNGVKVVECTDEYAKRTDPNTADSDGDGVSDGDEVNTYHTNPVNPDSDGDGVPDGQEVADGTDPLDSSDFKDSDADGVPDVVESADGTDPTDATDFKDSDADGVPDYVETNVDETDPNDASDVKDTDGDGVPDYVESHVDETDPADASSVKDSDGDEVPDYVESHVDETDPNDPDDVKDSDGDGVPDYVENKEGTDPADVDEFKDSDSDGLPDYVERHTCYDSSFNGVKVVECTDEYAKRTDPNTADSDGDGVSDGDEVNTYHTNPVNPDSDGDGVPDGQEVADGTDPLDSSSYLRSGTIIKLSKTGSWGLWLMLGVIAMSLSGVGIALAIRKRCE